MVNSLKHALELPGSSAMNNQDKCDPDWVGWHVLYGVLIPLNIVVGFSCSKTKHSTSLSVSTGQVQRAVHIPPQRPFVGQGESSHGVPACVPSCLYPSPLSPHGASLLGQQPTPMGLTLNKAAQAQTSTQMFMSCIKLHLSSDIWTFKAITSKFVTSVQSTQTMTRLMFPQKEPPCLAKAAGSHDQHSSAEKLVELCY